MKVEEFSNMFDVLLNSYNTQAQFGEGSSKQEITLDEYEKSVLLTQALDMVIKSYFDKTLNYQGQGFDDSTRRQLDFSSLVTVGTGTATDGTSYDSRGKLFTMPDKVLFILNEKVVGSDGKTYVVVPINYKEYDRLMSRAYTQPLKKQCWRLFLTDASSKLVAEIVTNKAVTISSYQLRFIKRPTPIVLTDLSGDNLSVDGISAKTECTLNPILHMDILQKAMDLAIQSKGTYADAAKTRAAEVQSKQ